MNPKERRIVAYHEMGHALVAAATPGVDRVFKVSIIPRGISALGYTIQRPTEDRYLMTRDELWAKMVVLMGGRAAEHVVFQHFSTGAADALAKIAQIARSMVTRYAMVEDFGHVSYEDERPGFLGLGGGTQRTYSDETAREIDAAVRTLVDQAFRRAVEVLEAHRPVLEEGAARLLEQETLSEGDMSTLCAECVPTPMPEATAPAGLVRRSD